MKLSSYIISVDVFYSLPGQPKQKIFLFGDYHLRDSEIIDRQKSSILGLLDNYNGESFYYILVEDEFNHHSELMAEKNLHFTSLLLGLIDKISSLNKPNIITKNIGVDFNLNLMLKCFNSANLPFFNGPSPSEIISLQKNNPYSICIRSLELEFEEMEQKLNQLLTCFCGEYSSDDGVICNHLSDIVDIVSFNTRKLLEIINECDIGSDDVIIKSAVDLYMSEFSSISDAYIRYNTSRYPGDMTFDSEKVRLELTGIINGYNQFMEIYPDMSDEYWEEESNKLVNDLLSFKGVHTRDVLPFKIYPSNLHRRDISNCLFKILFEEIETAALSEILLSSLRAEITDDEKIIIIFAGASHTKNIRNHLINLGSEYTKFKYVSELSISSLDTDKSPLELNAFLREFVFI